MKISAQRVARIIDAMASLTTGNYDIVLKPDESAEDEFTQVEYSVNFLAEQLAYERGENERKQSELTEKIDLIGKQQDAIFELSVPNIKVWDGVLIVPLIGTLDTRRSQRLTEELLLKIARTQSRVALIDITGVPALDSAVASHLLKTVSSVRLLGAQCAVTGIRPEVAGTMVNLGVDLADVQTLGDLAEGLKWALEYLELEIREKME